MEDVPSKKRVSWADLQEEEEAAREVRAMLLAPLTVEMLPKLPRQAPSVPFEAARNLYLAVVAGKSSHDEAMRWSRNLPSSAGSWVRRALLTHRAAQRRPASASKARRRTGR
jgi:hypothetical protein